MVNVAMLAQTIRISAHRELTNWCEGRRWFQGCYITKGGTGTRNSVELMHLRRERAVTTFFLEQR